MTIYVNENDPNEWKVFASDEFIKKNKEAEMKHAAKAAKANRQARLQESRQILKFYNQLQKQQNPQPSSLEQQQQQPTTQQSSGNNASNNSNNLLKHLQLMRRIAGENL
jgi:hypothetical protein